MTAKEIAISILYKYMNRGIDRRAAILCGITEIMSKLELLAEIEVNYDVDLILEVHWQQQIKDAMYGL